MDMASKATMCMNVPWSTIVLQRCHHRNELCFLILTLFLLAT